MVNPLIAFPGGWELVLILAVIVLLFGAKKLPDFARSAGSSLKIFKDETRGLMDDDPADDKADDKDGGDHRGADASHTPREIPPAGETGTGSVTAEQQPTERRDGASG